MAPLGSAVGISNDEFKPWRDLFVHITECILASSARETQVRSTPQLLRPERRRANALKFKGEILAVQRCGRALSGFVHAELAR